MKARLKSILSKRKKDNPKTQKTVYMRIVLVMIITVTIITAFSIVMGAIFLTNKLSSSIENDMMVVVDIADKYVSAEIETLKIKAADAAMRVDLYRKSGENAQALERCFADYPMFGGLAVYNKTTLLDSFGELSVPLDLYNEPFMQAAFNGGQSISTTMHNPDGAIIMCISAPMGDGQVLAAVMPGLYFSDLLSEFKLYETGHIFIDDAEGNVIVNIRSEWVESRINFIERAKTDSAYSGLSTMVERGISGESGNAQFSVSGVSRFCAFRPVSGSNEGWFLGVIVPKTESPLKEVFGGMLVIGIITLSLSIIASILAARVLKRPYDEAESFREEAEAASLTKSSFLANMSHEMRTPLNVVVGLTDLMLLEEKDAEDNRENVNKIRTAGITLLGIVNDILDISKIESGKMTLTPINYDTASFLNDTITLNIIRIAEKPISFVIDINDDFSSQLYGDDLRVKQVFNNLLSNAFKYTREGTVTLKIFCEREGSDYVWMDVTISDSGIGIRPENIDKLFSDYYQVDTKANRKIEGTGLGLAITRKLIEMMDGTIEVQSEYGKGTTFHVRIKQGFVNDVPIGPIVAKNLRSFRHSEEKRTVASLLIPIDLSYANVLVVDDFQTNLDVAVGLMRRYKMKIDCVMSGQEAIDRINCMNPIYDAIFMDHMMPEMDGIEATKRIRALDSDYAKTVPIIALTANAIVGSEQMFVENGFQAFLSKPIDIIKLDAALRQWVRDKSKEITFNTNSSTETLSSPEAQEENIRQMLQMLQIPGIDGKKGLSLYGFDFDTYLHVLRSYTTNMPAIIESLHHVSKENLAIYAINVHGLKGSSGNIGATNVMERAAHLEEAAKAGHMSEVLKENEDFLEEAHALEDAVKIWLAKHDEENQKPHLQTPDMALLSKLRNCCEQFDMNGVDEVMDELERFFYDNDNDLIGWLREKVDLSDLDSVEVRIKELSLQ